MKVERIHALPLTKEQALEYAGIIAAQNGGGAAAKLRYLGGGSFGRAVAVERGTDKNLSSNFCGQRA